MTSSMIFAFILFTKYVIFSIDVGVFVGNESSAMVQSNLDKGIKMAEADGIKVPVINFNYKFLMTCDGITGMKETLNLILNKSVDVIVGSNCHENCLATAQLSDYFNIPYLPISCFDTTLDDSKVYRTTLRIYGSMSTFGLAMKTIFNQSGWTRTTMLFESGAYFCGNIIEPIKKFLINQYVMVSNIFQLTTIFKSFLDDTLRKIKISARVIILCHTNFNDVFEIIMAAQSMGMTNPNNYAWIVVFNFYRNFEFQMLFQPWVHGTNASSNDLEKRRQAFLAVKILAYRNPIPIENLHDASRLRIGYLVEIMYVYLKLRDMAIKSGIEPTGFNIHSQSINQSFQGRYEVLMFGDNGDKMVPFSFWSLHPTFNSFKEMFLLYPISQHSYKIRIVGNVSWGESATPPPDAPICGFINEHCENNKGSRLNLLTILFLFLIVLFLIIIFRLITNRMQLLSKDWKIDYHELEFLHFPLDSCISNENLMRDPSSKKLVNPLSESNEIGVKMLASYKGAMVKVECISDNEIKVNDNDRLTLLQLKNLQHDNLVSFIGAFEAINKYYLVTQYCSRGPAEDIIYNKHIDLEWSFRVSFLHDIVKGMSYLHKSLINFHGRLSSETCMITNRWILKIDGFGLTKFRKFQKIDDEFYKRQLWKAPEIIKSNTLGSQNGDVYSFSILAYEIIFRTFPYQATNLSYKEVLEKVISGSANRPTFPNTKQSDVSEDLLSLLRRCWDEIPDNRPNFNEISKILASITSVESTNIVDSMLNKLEKYASNLESIIRVRTEKLVEEQKKTNTLLHSMLPPFVVEELKAGRKVEPRLYEMTTIFFSDIVGFTALSSESTPFEIVDLLNDLYGTFDDIIARYNVYKVETIGDAYMVVSGMPQETAKHAVEICNMALDLLRVVLTFKIRHRPAMTLMLRIGIHSGPCAAGVVGRIMPRYCLFGDTVNTASRMESTGEALKIHISEQTKNELKEFPGYAVQPRGPTEVKGKGVVMTYWLLKKDGY